MASRLPVLHPPRPRPTLSAVASNPALFRIAVTVVVAAFVLAELLGWLPPITADSVQPNR